MGVQVNPGGLDINSDLTFQGNNAYNLRSVRFLAQNIPITPSSPDLGCLYVAGVDLYFNDGGGTQIRVTQGGSVAGSSGTITGLPSGTASASYNSSTFVFQSSTSTAATIDAGSVIVRDETAGGNGVTLSAPTSLIGANQSIVLPVQPTTLQVMTLDAAGNMGTTSAGLPLSLLATAVTQALSPTGSITAYGGTSAPSGWLLCAGTAVSRTTYSALFSAIGTAYGNGDAPPFNVPQLQGLFMRGADNGAGNDPDASSRTALR